MIETDGLFLFLTGDPTVSGLVGNRVYGGMLPLGYVLPALVYSIVSTEPFESLAGDNPSEIRRFQFDCFAKDYRTTRLLSRAARSLLVPKSDGSGTTQTVTYVLPDGTIVQAARLHIDNDLAPEEGAGGSGGVIFRALLDIEFSYMNP
jgi:hypothetical protein